MRVLDNFGPRIGIRSFPTRAATSTLLTKVSHHWQQTNSFLEPNKFFFIQRSKEAEPEEDRTQKSNLPFIIQAMRIFLSTNDPWTVDHILATRAAESRWTQGSQSGQHTVCPVMSGSKDREEKFGCCWSPISAHSGLYLLFWSTKKPFSLKSFIELN